MSEVRHDQTVQKSPRRRGRSLVVTALAASVVTAAVVGLAFSDRVARPPAAVSLAGAAPSVAESHAPVQVTLPVRRVDRQRLQRERQRPVSRSSRRVTLERKPVVRGHRFTTAVLKLREEPRARAASRAVVPARAKVAVTGERRGAYAQVMRAGTTFWVTGAYLVKNKPPKPKPEPKPEPTAPATSPSASSSGATDITPSTPAPATGGVTTAPCARGSAVEAGLTSAAITVYRTVCARFPSIVTYGGRRGDGEHVSGKAIDVMVSGSLGFEVAEFLRANAGTLGLYDVIYSQRIWTQQRSGEGWRSMSDRGSTTANHNDHVHVAVY